VSEASHASLRPRRTLSRRGLALAPVLLVALSACSGPAREAGPPAWRQRVIPYYINVEANAVSERAIRGEFDEWSRQTPLTFVYAGRNAAGLRRDGKNTVSFLLHWPSTLPQKTAYCQQWDDRAGHIVEADIVFNCSLARFTTNATARPDSYRLEGVLSHEIGHLLGLGHSTSPLSLMKPDSTIAESWFKGAIDSETLGRVAALYTAEPAPDVPRPSGDDMDAAMAVRAR